MTNFEKINKIANRAIGAGLLKTTILTFMIDVDKAVEAFDLDLDGLLAAAPFDFAHDVTGIQRYIDRSTETFAPGFVPRFAGGRKKEGRA